MCKKIKKLVSNEPKNTGSKVESFSNPHVKSPEINSAKLIQYNSDIINENLSFDAKLTEDIENYQSRLTQFKASKSSSFIASELIESDNLERDQFSTHDNENISQSDNENHSPLTNETKIEEELSSDSSIPIKLPFDLKNKLVLSHSDSSFVELNLSSSSLQKAHQNEKIPPLDLKSIHNSLKTEINENQSSSFSYATSAKVSDVEYSLSSPHMQQSIEMGSNPYPDNQPEVYEYSNIEPSSGSFYVENSDHNIDDDINDQYSDS